MSCVYCACRGSFTCVACLVRGWWWCVCVCIVLCYAGMLCVGGAVGGILCCVHMSLSCVVQCVCGGGGAWCNSLLSPSVYVMLTRSTCNKSWTELSWLWKCETGRISAVNMRVGPFLQTEICYKLPQQGWARPVRLAKTKSAGEMFFLSLVKRNAAFLALPTPLCGKSLYNAVRELVRLAYLRWNGACGRWNTQRRM